MSRTVFVMGFAIAVVISGVLLPWPASARMEQPVWTVGDYWLFRVNAPANGPGAVTITGTVRMEVAGTETVGVGGISYPSWRLLTMSNVTATGPLTAYINGSGFTWFRTSDFAFVKQDLRGTQASEFGTYAYNITEERGPPQDLQWPLTDGSTWTTTGWWNATWTFDSVPIQWTNVTVVSAFSVHPNQPVTVPSGTFSAVPIREQEPNRVGPYNMSYWSPEAGNYVRQQWFDNQGQQTRIVELLSYRHQVSPDRERPRIVHTPPSGPFFPNTTIRIQATVTDNDQVLEVRLLLTDVTQIAGNFTMASSGGNVYEYTIPAQGRTGTVKYRIYALDVSDNVNITSEARLTIENATQPPPSPPSASPPGILLYAGIGIVAIIAAVAIALAIQGRRRRAAPPTDPP